jgi:hypothetical protein
VALCLKPVSGHPIIDGRKRKVYSNTNKRRNLDEQVKVVVAAMDRKRKVYIPG